MKKMVKNLAIGIGVIAVASYVFKIVKTNRQVKREKEELKEELEVVNDELYDTEKELEVAHDELHDTEEKLEEEKEKVMVLERKYHTIYEK